MCGGPVTNLIIWSIGNRAMRTYWTDSKIRQLRKQLLGGWTLKEAGEHHGFSREYIRVIVGRHLPEITRNDYGRQLKVKLEADARKADFLKRKGRPAGKHATEFSKRCSLIFFRKRQNAKRTGWPWTVELKDVEFPTHCPMLGIKLDYSGKAVKENSPSFDRLNTKKGYVKGNVIICSWRANRIKNDGTAKEHELIAKFMRG